MPLFSRGMLRMAAVTIETLNTHGTHIRISRSGTDIWEALLFKI